MTLGIKPLGPSVVKEPYLIENLPPLLIGGTVFNTLFSEDPYKVPAVEILNNAFCRGLNAIDTSPYYGPSEEILGNALKQIKSKWPRSSYYISTKAGRIGENEFDYSRESVRNSVLRSLKRLDTEYLDLVFMHDIEFVSDTDIFGALKELKLMKNEGLVRNIGVSGYPLDLLYKVAFLAKTEYTEDIGPLDVVLSYSNGCLQNTRLFEMYERFFSQCSIKKLLNGSILSMSLLRSGSTHSFHPASPQLKSKVQAIAQHLKDKYNIELADLATRFAIRKWLFETEPQNNANDLEWNSKCSIILGVASVQEFTAALENYWNVKCNINEINSKDQPIFDEVKELFGDKHWNETWSSGIEHNL